MSHFADDETIALIAKLQATIAEQAEAIKQLQDIIERQALHALKQ